MRRVRNAAEGSESTLSASVVTGTTTRGRAAFDVRGIVKAMGVVFGDIGTSPIYTLTVIFMTTPPTEANVLGVLSLIVWTLIVLVSLEYAWLATSLGEKGQGGEIVLRGVLLSLLRKGRGFLFVTFLTFAGVSLVIGDGVITPAISILSAVEGMRVIPGLEAVSQKTVLVISAVIALFLFLFQKRGTERVASAFGPIMLVWFLAIGVSGLVSIVHTPSVLKALNPYYGLAFIYRNGLAGFFILSEVILCATGAEALFADMGHLGRKPILKAWCFVFVALVFCVSAVVRSSVFAGPGATEPLPVTPAPSEPSALTGYTPHVNVRAEAKRGQSPYVAPALDGSAAGPKLAITSRCSDPSQR